MKKQIGSLILISTLVSGCGGPVAMVSSSTGFMASNDFYVKAYNGIDMLTIMKTEKDIKIDNTLTLRSVELNSSKVGMPFYFRDLRDDALIFFRAYML